MIRIKGTVGELPVDLTIEMEAADWAQLGAHASGQGETIPASAVSTPAKPAPADEPVWLNTLKLVEQAGRIDGPELLGLVEGLAGSTGAGKRLLVRLRHCAQIRVESGADAPVYCWVG